MALLPSSFTPGSRHSSDPFLILRREMNRLFDEALGGAFAATGQSGSQGGTFLAPSMDVSETDTEVRIQADLPGVNEKEIEVSLDDNVLTLRAEKKQERSREREGIHINERRFGTFRRSLRLPFRVDPDQVQAHYENGVLSITLSKAQQREQSRRIPVRGAQPQIDAQQDNAKTVSMQRAGVGQSQGMQAGQAAVHGHVAGIDAVTSPPVTGI